MIIKIISTRHCRNWVMPIRAGVEGGGEEGGGGDDNLLLLLKL